jgi:hypothetical protein
MMASIAACQAINRRNGIDNNEALELRGGRFIISGDVGSNANASAGNTSVTRFIQRI